jgi:cell division protein FtsB
MDVFIFAANALGKTRLVSAFTWLLFGKDALGRADFEIKNLNAEGESTHNLEHAVEAELNINGQVCILRKVFSEKWTKKRGSANREFSGHTTNYFVDGVPVQEKDYVSRISDIAGDELRFKLLTSPTIFPNLPAEKGVPGWQRQRAILLEVCGDISDTNVIATETKLTPLLEVVKSRRSEINKEMEKIPVRIDEVRRGLPDVTGINRGEAEKEVQHFEASLNDAKLRLQGVDTGGSIADLTKKVSGLNADLRKMEDAHRSGSLSTLNRLNHQISELDAKVNGSRRRMDSINGDLKWKDGGLQTLENIDLPKLREKWTVIDAEVFQTYVINDICPSCGQTLPPTQVQAARDKALASFNQNKAERLGEVDRKGQSLKEQRNKLKAEIDKLREERATIEDGLPTFETDFAKAENDRNTLKQSSENFSGVRGRPELLVQISEIEGQIKVEREGKTQDVEKIKGEISALQTVFLVAKGKIDMFTRREQGEKRIEELKTEEKKLAAEFEKLEGELYLIEQFIKTKVSMLTDRINGKFEMVRFKLFNVLINGGIEDCCEITVNGVPFNGGLNSAARTQAGCDIIRTLQQHFGMRAPVFVDNRESVSDLPEMGCQLISLVVSPEDKILRVEVKQIQRGAGYISHEKRAGEAAIEAG